VDAALEAFDRALTLDFTFSSAWENLAQTLLKLRRYDEALAVCAQWLLLQPQSADAWRIKSIVHWAQRQYSSALAAADQAVKLQATTNSHSTRAVALTGLKRYLLALADLEQALRRQSASDCGGCVWNNIGVVLYELGREEDALVLLEHALTLDTSVPSIWCSKGEVLWRLGQSEAALEAFERALALDQELADAWIYQALALMRLGRHEEARAALERAQKLDAGDPALWWAISVSHLAEHRAGEALDAIEEALRLDPEEPEPWRSKADALRALGRPDEAAEAEARAAELEAHLEATAAQIPTVVPLHPDD